MKLYRKCLVTALLVLPTLVLGLSANRTWAAPKPQAFIGGFNQAWLHDRFGSQWLDGNYDPTEAQRILKLTQDAGAKVLRMWILEGKTNSGLLWSPDGIPFGIRPDVLKNIRDFSLLAAKFKVQIEWTLFTGDPWDFSDLGNDLLTEYRRRWWNIFHDLFGFGEALRSQVLKPLIETLTTPDTFETVFAIDLMNEIDTRVIKMGFDQKWASANDFICKTRNSLKTLMAPRDLLVTASVGWPAVPFINPGAIVNILQGNLNLDCVDLVEIHLYNDTGTIESCDQLRALAQKKPVYLGEFGQFSSSYDDALQAKVTENFVRNAQACGLAGAFAWRLSDVRPGQNPEARYSFEAFGSPRPAYGVFQALLKALQN